MDYKQAATVYTDWYDDDDDDDDDDDEMIFLFVSQKQWVCINGQFLA